MYVEAAAPKEVLHMRENSSSSEDSSSEGPPNRCSSRPRPRPRPSRRRPPRPRACGEICLQSAKHHPQHDQGAKEKSRQSKKTKEDQDYMHTQPRNSVQTAPGVL
eukprot:gb/GEZN01019737.1/.p2 GENE.gb/GEZN01019737.1/~~gb/GEZN01019737.1/.p2  ORF type:complete len:105 (-),score=11.12 gb/GEZN01019737.1/:312-626(-)